MASLGGMGAQGGLGNKVLSAPLDLLDPLATRVTVRSSTPGGGRVPALRHQALSCSTLASLEGHNTMLKGVELIISACPRTQSTAPPSNIELELIRMLLSMVQSMNTQYKEHMIMMYLVLYAACLPDPL